MHPFKIFKLNENLFKYSLESLTQNDYTGIFFLQKISRNYRNQEETGWSFLLNLFLWF